MNNETFILRIFFPFVPIVHFSKFSENVYTLTKLTTQQLMTRRKLLIWILCLLSLWQAGTSSPLLAGPAYPGLITVKQSDGSEIRVRVHGDEFRNYVTSEEGYTLAADADGDWAFAKLDANGLLVPTSVKAKNASRLTDSERKILGTSLRKNLRPLRMTGLQMRSRSGTRKCWCSSLNILTFLSLTEAMRRSTTY